MKIVATTFMTASIFLAAAGSAVAAEPAAIVEAVSPPRADIAAMEMVRPGRIIEVGPRGSLVLGYLRSCIRERIRGGSVTVGALRSTVTGGRITREQVDCRGGRLELTAEQAGKSGALIFRRPPKSRK